MRKLHISEFDAVAFDFDGTLADSIATHSQADLLVLEEFGFGHVDPSNYPAPHTFGSDSHMITGGILFAAGEIDDKIPFTEHELVRKIVARRKEILCSLAKDGHCEQPNASKFIKNLHQAGFQNKLAIVTASTIHHVGPFLDRYKITDVFRPDLLISQEDVMKHGLELKPKPDAYNLAIKRLNVNPERLIVIEDTTFGVEAGKLAGAKVIAVSTTASVADFNSVAIRPDFIVSDFSEALDLLGL